MDLLAAQINLTEREEQIINIAVERALLLTPEAMQRMIIHKTILRDLTRKFYDENKDFTGHEDLVNSLIEKTVLDNPGLPLDKILSLAAPLIREKMAALTTMNFKPVDTKPTPTLSDHGAL